MIVCGVDIGSSSAKAAIMEDSKVISSRIIPTGPDSAETARKVVEEALNTNGLSMKHIQYIVSTGYGRVNVPFAQRISLRYHVMPEALCQCFRRFGLF